MATTKKKRTPAGIFKPIKLRLEIIERSGGLQRNLSSDRYVLMHTNTDRNVEYNIDKNALTIGCKTYTPEEWLTGAGNNYLERSFPLSSKSGYNARTAKEDARGKAIIRALVALGKTIPKPKKQQDIFSLTPLPANAAKKAKPLAKKTTMTKPKTRRTRA